MAVVGPSGETQGVGPDANSGEEVALSISRNVIWRDILNASFIHVS
jgi:hypothetical protein